MDKPKIADKKPAVLTLDPGTYYWCSCGSSKKQPFCDGSHKGTSFTPIQFDLTEKRQAPLCNCKHTQKKPFCDGTHTKI